MVAAAAADSADDCVPGIAIDPASLGHLTGWPKVFRLTSPNPSDPTLPNAAVVDTDDEGLLDDDDALGPEILIQAGVEYRYLDPTGYTYPNATKAIPWSPPANGTNDPALQQLRKANDYQYADIVVVTGYMDKFYEEHIVRLNLLRCTTHGLSEYISPLFPVFSFQFVPSTTACRW